MDGSRNVKETATRKLQELQMPGGSVAGSDWGRGHEAGRRGSQERRGVCRVSHVREKGSVTSRFALAASKFV